MLPAVKNDDIAKKYMRQSIFSIKPPRSKSEIKKREKSELELEKDLKNIATSLKTADSDIKVLIRNQRVSSCLDNSEVHRFISNTEMTQCEELLANPETSPLKKRIKKSKAMIQDENEMKKKFDHIENSKKPMMEKFEKKFIRRFKNDEDINQTKLKFTEINPNKRTKIYPYTVYKKNRFRILKSGNELYVKTFCGKGKDSQLDYKPQNKFNRSASLVAQTEKQKPKRNNMALNLTSDNIQNDNTGFDSLDFSNIQPDIEPKHKDPEIERLIEKWKSPKNCIKYLNSKRKFIGPPRFGSVIKNDDCKSVSSDTNHNDNDSALILKENPFNSFYNPSKFDEVKTDFSEDIKISHISKLNDSSFANVEVKRSSILRDSNYYQIPEIKKSRNSLRDSIPEVRLSTESKMKNNESQSDYNEQLNTNKFTLGNDQINETKNENDEVESIALSEEFEKDLKNFELVESYKEKQHKIALSTAVASFIKSPSKYENIIDKATGITEINKDMQEFAHMKDPRMESSAHMTTDDMLKATAESFFNRAFTKKTQNTRTSRMSINSSILRSRTAFQRKSSILSMENSRTQSDKDKINRLMNVISNIYPDERPGEKVLEMQAKAEIRAENLTNLLQNYRDLNHLEAPILLSIYQYTKAAKKMNEEEQDESIAKFLEEQKMLDVNVVKIKRKAMKLQLNEIMNRKRILRHDKMYNVKF